MIGKTISHYRILEEFGRGGLDHVEALSSEPIRRSTLELTLSLPW